MSPEFAAALDPVMLEVLALVERARSGRAGRPVEEHSHIRGVLEQGASRVPGTRIRDWELASYALISLIDELLIVDIPWKGQAWWENNALEVEMCRTRDRATEFYGRAEEAVGLASRDALEVFILAVVLGFRGIFRDQLPSLRQWLRTQEQLVRVGDGRPPLPDTAPELSGAPPLSGGSRLLWASLIATMVTACVFVAAWRIVMR